MTMAMANNFNTCSPVTYATFNRNADNFVTDISENNARLRTVNSIIDNNRSKRRKLTASGAEVKAVPWKKREYYSHGVVGLHEEISDFFDVMSPTVEEKEIRLRVVEHIQQTVHSLWSQAKVEVFGSFRTGLYLPTSDIDMVVTGKWESLPLNTLRTALSKSGIDDRDISVLSHASVPIVRLVHSQTKVKVDISFNVLNGVKSAEMIKDFIKFYPALPKLVLILKQFLVHRGLNEVYYGGMSSYSLTLLVISFLQGHHKPKSVPVTNLGTLLIEFFELYGVNFNYEKVSITVRNGGSYRPKQNPWGSYLSVEDPLCPDNDIAKGTYLMREIKNAFENAYNTLHKAVTEVQDYRSLPSILKLILDVDTEVFIQRQWLHDHIDEILDTFMVRTSRWVTHFHQAFKTFEYRDIHYGYLPRVCSNNLLKISNKEEDSMKDNVSRTVVFNSSGIKVSKNFIL